MFISTFNLPSHTFESEKFSHCFSTCFPFHKLQLCFIHRQILIHLRHWDQNKQKALCLFNTPAYHASLNFLCKYLSCLLRPACLFKSFCSQSKKHCNNSAKTGAQANKDFWKLIINDIAFVWCARLILSHQLQFIVSLSCFKSPQKLLSKGLGVPRVISCSPVDQNFASILKTSTFKKN